MKLPNYNRRQLLRLLYGTVLVPALAGVAEARVRGAPGGSFFNGGLSQTNLNFLQGGGEHPFANYLKCGQAWTWADNNLTDPLTPDLFDTNGYPVASTLFTAHGGVVTGNCFIPTQTELAGDWVLEWVGGGTVGVVVAQGGGSISTVSGGPTSSPWRFNPGATASALNVSITGVGPTKLQLYNVNDNNPNTTTFTKKFLARLREAKFGVIRFLNWQVGNTTNVTTWDTADRGVDYYQFNSGSLRIDLLCNLAGSGITTNSGADYTVSAPSTWSGTPGSLPPDKATVHLVWNASSPTRTTVTFTGGGSSDINWAGTLPAVGNTIYFDNLAGTAPSEIVTEGANAPYFPIMNSAGTQSAIYYVVFASAGVIRVSATPGGSAITFATTGSGTTTGRILPTVAVGGCLPAPVLDANGNPPTPTGSGNTYPIGGTAGSLNTLVFDATIGAWLGCFGGGSRLQNGVPPSLMLQLCREVGAHPSFVMPPYALTNMTDYVPSLVALNIAVNPAWMVPRYEMGPNELWNTSGGFIQTGYAGIVATMYGWNLPGASSKDINNWYGRAASTVGQAVATGYGVVKANVKSQTKYKTVAGVQTQNVISPSAATSNNARLASTKYLLQTPQSPYAADPASDWATTFTFSNYFIPAWYGRNDEVRQAFSYYVTNSGNPSGQASDAAAYEATVLNGFAVTFTNGSPGTVNAPAHGMAAGQIASLITLGTLPTGASTGNVWVNTVPTADTLTLSSTDPNNGGATPVNFSGTPTGTSYLVPYGNSTIPANLVFAENIRAWAAGFGIVEGEPYEGCYSPDLDNDAVTSGVSAATQTNPCIVTLPVTVVQGIRFPNAQQNATNPAAVIGMYLQFANVGGMTQLNGNRYEIVGVGVADGLLATQVAINVDATGFSAYTSGGTATYQSDSGGTSMAVALNALRNAGKNAPDLETHMTSLYNSLVGLAGVKYPSNYLVAGGESSIWPNLTPNIYVTPDPPQWLAIKAFNA